MEEENKEVVEETTTKVTQGDPGDEHVEKPSPVSINEDGDYKVDLSIPLEPENETQDVVKFVQNGFFLTSWELKWVFNRKNTRVKKPLFL